MALATFGTLAGKGVVITGAAAGIGRATALYLAGEGVRVVVSDIDADAGKVVGDIDTGDPMFTHRAVVAREFGIPCVVDVQDATRRLPSGALVEVDGTSGKIQVLELDLPSVTP